MTKKNKRRVKIVLFAGIILLPAIIFLFKNKTATKSGLLSVITKPMQSSRVSKMEVDKAAVNHASYIFLDAREKEEYDVSHIANALFVGDKDFNIAKIRQLPRDAAIIVYCAVGVRSDKIAGEIIDGGYTKVSNLDGGIFEWVNKGYPVFDSSGSATGRIHAYSPFWGQFVNADQKIY